MDDLAPIPWLARELEQAASDKDWQKVQQVDGQIALFLTETKGRPLSDAMKRDLAQLRQIHQRVYRLCQQESSLLEEKMARSLKNREGASAYAAFMSTEEGR
jgi:hypothetical protein